MSTGPLELLIVRVIVVGIGSAALVACSGAGKSPESHLEARLLAPCCYLQTLETHESPLASRLRSEVHDRLAQGESMTVIEEDLVMRYGPRIRAVPFGFSIDRMGALLIALTASGITIPLVLALRLCRRKGRISGPAVRVEPRDSSMEDRLDDELDEFDS